MSAYDYTPKSGSSSFVRLEGKGDSINIRLACEPVREYKVWRDGETTPIDDEQIAKLDEERIGQLRREIDTATGKPKYRVSEQFTWVVIDREDGQAKVYTAPSSVYNKIKSYALNTKWGDPSNYDFTITRTEQPGTNYYDVMADPDKSKLTEDEKAAAAEIDLTSIRPYAKPLGAAKAKSVEVEFGRPTPKSKDVVLDDIPEGDPLEGLNLADQL